MNPAILAGHDGTDELVTLAELVSRDRPDIPAQGVPVSGESGYRYLTRATRPMMWDALGPDERRYLLRVLSLVGGNKSRAAQVLGFDRRTLYRKLERFEKVN